MKYTIILLTIIFITFGVAVGADAGRSADVLIGVHVNGESQAWWNPGATYSAALLAAGAANVETVYAPEGGSIPFPNPFTPYDYPVCVVLTTENWLAPPENFGPAEEAVLSDYCAAGGAVLIVGQDLLYGAHHSWGNAHGFFKNYMGLSSVQQDVLTTPNPVTWTGETGGPLNDMSGTTSSGNPWPPFLANVCAADDLTPVAGANTLLTGTAGTLGPYATGIYYDRAAGRTLYRTCFVAYELAADAGNFKNIIAALYGWLTEGVDVEPASLGKIKAAYR